MTTVDTKKNQGIITPNWETFDNDSEPFFLKGQKKTVNNFELILKDRYVTVVVTNEEYSLQSREELQSLMDAQRNEAKRKILDFYGKVEPENSSITATAEGWYVDTRPGSKLKVLLSVPAEQVDGLFSRREEALGLQKAEYEVLLNTRTIEKQVDSMVNILNEYQNQTRKVYGKIEKFSFLRQRRKMENFIPSLESLLQRNDLTFESNVDQPLILGLSKSMKPVYVIATSQDVTGPILQWYQKYLGGQEECVFPLDEGFSSFIKEDAPNDPRTMAFIKEIDTISSFTNLNKPSIGDFLEKYVYNPPLLDLNNAAFKSPPMSQKAEEVLNKMNMTMHIRTPEQEQSMVNLSNDPELREQLQKSVNNSADWVGDNIIGNLRSISNNIHSVRQAYRKVLNVVPIPGLIEAALECLNIRGVGDILNAASLLLNQAEQMAGQIKQLILSVPTFYFPDNFPIVDYLQSMGKQIIRGIINAIFSSVVAFLIELLMSLLDFCKECALQNVTSGKGRFDGSNFGALNANALLASAGNGFSSAVVGGIISGLSRPNFKLDLGSDSLNSVGEQLYNKIGFENTKEFKYPNISTEYQKLLDGTERFTDNRIKNPITSKTLTEEEKRELEEQARKTKEEMAGFLNAASAILTPGEMGNMMLGCGAGNEPLNALQNLLNSYPSIANVIKDKDDILDFFKNIGSLVGYKPVLEAVTQATDSIPEDITCLCDVNDEALRKALLEQKNIAPELIDELVKSSQERLRQRQQALVDALNSDKLFESAMPPIFCTVDAEGNIIPGMLPNDHPVLRHTMKGVLNTAYNKLAVTFSRDAKNFFPLMTTEPLKKVIVPRTKEVTLPNGNKNTIFNPDFLDLVGKGLYTYGALPPGVTDEDGDSIDNQDWLPSSPPALPNFGSLPQYTDEQNAARERSADPNSWRFVTWTGAYITLRNKLGVDIDPDDVDQARGMTRPFAESEKLYELYNTKPNGQIGGRHDFNNFYTKKYGYSPVPIYKTEKGEATFAPGFREVYETFCGIEGSGQQDPYPSKLNIYKINSSEVYNFEIPNNLVQNLGFDIDLNDINAVSLEGGDGIGAGAPNIDLSVAIGAISQSRFNLSYLVPFNTSIGKQRFSLAVSLEQGAAGSAPPVFLNSIRVETAINPQAYSAINRRGIYPNNLFEPIPQISNNQEIINEEKYFSNVVQKGFDLGGRLYVDNQDNDFIYGLNLLKQGEISTSLSTQIGKEIKKSVLEDDSYNELWKDLYCSFTNQISDSPFFDLEKLLALDLAPMRRTDSAFCAPHLLDIDAVKERIMEEYEMVLCLDASAPVTDGLGSSSEQPFQKANLGGVVLLTIRAYIMEVLLKSVQSFYYFRYRTPDDVDPLIARFMAIVITQGVTDRNYIDQFEKETIDLYKRNFPESGDDVSYDTAINHLTKYQIWSVSNRLSKLVGSLGDITLDSVLMEEWIPFADIQKSIKDSRFKKGEVRTMSDDLNYISQGEIDALTIGELSSEKINDLSGPWATSKNIMKVAPAGYLFREYFTGLRDFSQWTGYPSEGSPIWSLEPGSDDEDYPRLGRDSLQWLGNEGSRVSGFSKFTQSGVNDVKSGIKLGHKSRERGILWASDIMQDSENWAEFKREKYNKLAHDGTLKYKYGVSQEEKNGMSTLIKFLLSSFQPTVFTEHSHVPASLQSNPSTIPYYPGYFLKKWFEDNKRNEPYRAPLSNGDGFVQLMERNPNWRNATSAEDKSNVLLRYGSPINSRYFLKYGLSYTPGGGAANIPLINLNFDTFADDGGATWPQYDGWEPNVVYADGEYFSPWRLWENLGDPAYANDDGDQPYARLFEALEEYPGSVRFIAGQAGGVIIGNTSTAYDGETWHPAIYPNVNPFPPQTQVFAANNSVDQNVLKWVKIGSAVHDGTRKDVVISNIIPRKIQIGNQNFGPFVFRYTSIDQQGHASISGRPVQIGGNDPWIYDGPDTYVFFPRYEEWASGGSSSTILNPGGNRGTAHYTLFNHAQSLFIDGYNGPTMPYISLLDFDIDSIKNILVWEKSQIGSDVTLSPDEIRDFQAVYDVWISQWDEAVSNFHNAANGRLKLRQKLYEKVTTLPQKRRPMKKSLITDFENGGLVLEPYIRYEPVSASRSSSNRNQLNAIIKDDYDKGIVNIDRFQEIIDEIGGGVILAPPTIPGAGVDICGGTLTTRPNKIDRTTIPEGLKLGDYFESVHMGLRLSYVPRTMEWSKELRTRSATGAPIPGNHLGSKFGSQKTDILAIPGNFTAISHSKAYYVSEQADINGQTYTADVNITPIVQTETLLDSNISFNDLHNTFVKETNSIDERGYAVSTQENIGFFRTFYDSESGLRALKNQMISSEDYKMMFKYLFPVDRMLSLNQIYSNVYLSTFKDVGTAFNSTKECLRLLLFAYLDSGSWKASNCKKSNSDLKLDLLNGFAPEELLAMLAKMALRTSLLIFKGFVEVADPNVSFSKKIIDLIHFANQNIAMAQMITNQAIAAGSQLAQGTAQLIDSLEDLVSDCNDKLPDSCKVEKPPLRPPDAFFDPVEENFIPEPQTWQIGVPLWILSFFGAGIPITPFAVPYWILDNKPNPNWLGQGLDDWLTQMLNKDKTLLQDAKDQPAFDDCKFDLGLPSPSANADAINAYYASLSANLPEDVAQSIKSGTYLSDYRKRFQSSTQEPPASPPPSTQEESTTSGISTAGGNTPPETPARNVPSRIGSSTTRSTARDAAGSSFSKQGSSSGFASRPGGYTPGDEE